MNYTFFDSLEENNPNSSLWSKYIPPIHSIHQIHSGTLKKPPKSSDDELSNRYFILDREYLLYKKDETAISYSGSMRIKFAKVVIPDDDDPDPVPLSMIKGKYPIKLISKNKFSLIYAETLESRDNWIQAFNKTSFRIDFHSRFSVSKIIGSGSFANVYESIENKTGKLYGVKGFNKLHLENESHGKKSLMNEISILREVNHNNLLKLHEVHETKNSVYLVLDLYQGGELCKIIDGKKRELKEEEIVNITEGLLMAVNYLESKKIVHRDIKPNNIILRKNIDIKPEDIVLVDFGLAANANEPKLLYKRCGTPGYIAPEIIGAKNIDDSFTVDTKSDVYCVGLTVYVCITGVNPFEKADATVDDIIRRNLENNISYPEDKFRNVSTDMMKLVKQMLCSDPQKRISAKSALNHGIFEYSKFNDEMCEIDLEEFTEEELTQKINFIDSIRSLEKKVPMNRKPSDISSHGSIGVNSKGGIVVYDSKKKQNMGNLYKQSLISRANKEGGQYMDDFDNDSVFSSMNSSNASSSGSGNQSPNENMSHKSSSPNKVKRSTFGQAFVNKNPFKLSKDI